MNSLARRAAAILSLSAVFALSAGAGSADAVFSFCSDKVCFEAASADGTRVLFSTREPLTRADTDGATDIYEHAGGTDAVVSTGPGGSGESAVAFVGASSDATRVLFLTDASLLPADSDTADDLYEREGGTTTLVSTGPSGGNGDFDVYDFGRAISADGSRAYFETGESLVPADTDTSTDVYLRSAGATTLVSTGPQAGGPDSTYASLVAESADGSRVLFDTAEPLTAGDTDSRDDIYERSGGTTTLLTGGSAAPCTFNGSDRGDQSCGARFEGATADATRLFFSTYAQLSAADTDEESDVYEGSTGTITLLSTGPAGGNGDYQAQFGGSSADGSRVFLVTRESMVAADSDDSFDLYERSGGSTTLVSTGSRGNEVQPYGGEAEFGAIGPGGEVIFTIDQQLVGADEDSSDDVYSRAAGETTLLSDYNDDSFRSVSFVGVSADGARIYMESIFDNVFVREGGVTTLLSKGPLLPGGARFGLTKFRAASDDGGHVFFTTQARLTPDDSRAGQDVYERRGGQTVLISGGATRVTSGPFGTTADRTPTFAFRTVPAPTGTRFQCSIDGSRFRACRSPFTYERLDLGPHVFSLRAVDPQAGPEPTPVSRAFRVVERRGPFRPRPYQKLLAVSADGHRVIFATGESLSSADGDQIGDIYARRGSRTILLTPGTGAENCNLAQYGDCSPIFKAASHDGSRVLFATGSSLVPADTDSSFDLYERAGAAYELVSTGPDGGNGPYPAAFGGISEYGSVTLFTTREQLLAADTDAYTDLYSRSGSTTTLLSTGPAGGNGAGDVAYEGESADGSTAYFTTAESLDPADGDTRVDLYSRSQSSTTLLTPGPPAGACPAASGDQCEPAFGAASVSGDHAYFRASERLDSADTDDDPDLYEHSAGGARLVSGGPGSGTLGADAVPGLLRVSRDGSRALFATRESLLSEDRDFGFFDVYSWSGGDPALVSVGPRGGELAFDAGFDDATADLGSAYFFTGEPLLGADRHPGDDLYRRSAAGLALIPQAASVFFSFPPRVLVSDDGSHLAFETTKALLKADRDGRENDVYGIDRGRLSLLSVGPTHASAGRDPRGVDLLGVSADGAGVVFKTRRRFTRSDRDKTSDIYERIGGTTILVSGR